jgi:hypothetical protein
MPDSSTDILAVLGLNPRDMIKTKKGYEGLFQGFFSEKYFVKVN